MTKTIIKTFLNGILYENPILIILIGLCPTLACSSSLSDAIGMGISVTFVLVCSNVIISSIRKLVPSEIRIPVFIVIIATFVTITDYTIQAYFPALSKSLGVFIPLIVVNCIILGRAEAFAYKNNVILSFVDGIGMGLGFTIAICGLAFIRELLGNGTLFGSKPFFSNPILMFILPPGAFIGIGILISIWQYIKKTSTPKIKPCNGCSLSSICYHENMEKK